MSPLEVQEGEEHRLTFSQSQSSLGKSRSGKKQKQRWNQNDYLPSKQAEKRS